MKHAKCLEGCKCGKHIRSEELRQKISQTSHSRKFPKDEFIKLAEEYGTARAVSNASGFSYEYIRTLFKQYEIQRPSDPNKGGGNFLGKTHTDEAKKKISENSWSRTEEGRTKRSDISKKMWETRDRTTSDETRKKMSASHIGNTPGNKRGKIHTCEVEGCNNTFWVSPSVNRRFCSISCGLTTRDSEIIGMSVAAMRKKIPRISDAELRLGALLLLSGIEVYSQTRVGRFFLDWYDEENKLDWECDGEYWHSHPNVVIRAPRRAAAIEQACLTTIRLDTKEIPQWEELENLI